MCRHIIKTYSKHIKADIQDGNIYGLLLATHIKLLYALTLDYYFWSGGGGGEGREISCIQKSGTKGALE